MRKNRKILLIVFVSFLVIVNIALLAAGNYFYNVAMNYNVTNKYSQGLYDKTAALVKFNEGEFDFLQKDYVTIKSRYGYDLKGIFIKNPVPTEDTVIIVHGVGMDKKWSFMKYGNIFLDRATMFLYTTAEDMAKAEASKPAMAITKRMTWNPASHMSKPAIQTGSLAFIVNRLELQAQFCTLRPITQKVEFPS